MPAADPVCARAGELPSAIAAAAVNAIARDAGPTGRTLLGGLAAIMWDKYGSLGPGTQAMDGTSYGQHGAGPLRRRGQTSRNPANTAAPGRRRRRTNGRSRRIDA